MTNVASEIFTPVNGAEFLINNQCWFAMKESTGHILITGKTGTGKTTLASWFGSETRSYYYFQRDKMTHDDNLNILTIHDSIIIVDDMDFITPSKTDAGIIKQLCKPNRNQFILISHHHPGTETASYFQTEISLSKNDTERKASILIKGIAE